MRSSLPVLIACVAYAVAVGPTATDYVDLADDPGKK